MIKKYLCMLLLIATIVIYSFANAEGIDPTGAISDLQVNPYDGGLTFRFDFMNSNRNQDDLFAYLMYNSKEFEDKTTNSLTKNRDINIKRGLYLSCDAELIYRQKDANNYSKNYTEVTIQGYGKFVFKGLYINGLSASPQTANGTNGSRKATLEVTSDDTKKFILTTYDNNKYTFNGQHKLVYIDHANGNQTKLIRKDLRVLTAIEDNYGRRISINYDGNSRISEIVDPLGNKTTFSYVGSAVKIKKPNELEYSLDFSANSLFLLNNISMTSPETSENTTIATFQYSSDYKRVKSYTKANGLTINYSEVANSGVTVTDSEGRISEYKYSSSGELLSVKNPLKEVVSYTYDLNGNLLSVSSENGSTTLYEYDENGNLLKTIHPDGTKLENSYDKYNNLITSVDENGNKCYNIYSEDGLRLLKKVKPIDGVSVYNSTSKASNFDITRYVYYTDTELDRLGYKSKLVLKGEYDNDNNYTEYHYDTYGNLKEKINALGVKHQYSYDNLGYLIEETNGGGIKTQYHYDTMGNLIKKIVAGDRVERYLYNKKSQLIQKVLPAQYKKDSDSKTTYLDTQVGYRYVYDQMGNLTQITDPANRITKYEYDKYGNKIKEVNALNITYTYEYDLLNRLTKYGRLNNGLLVPLKSYEYTIYNDLALKGKLRQETEWTYHDEYNGKIKSEIKFSETKTYDQRNRLVKVVNAEGQISEKKYDGVGNLIFERGFGTKIALPNATMTQIRAYEKEASGSESHYVYDASNNLTESWAPMGNGQYSYKEYVFNHAGLVIEERIGKELVKLHTKPTTYITTSKKYDAIGRLVEEHSGDGPMQKYVYNNQDALIEKSLISKTGEVMTASYEYDDFGQQIKETVQIDAHDVFGNNSHDTSKLDLITLKQYDASGNLIQLINPEGQITRYKYDLANNLIEKQWSVSVPDTVSFKNNALVEQVKEVYTYNQLGLLTSKYEIDGKRTENDYDQNGFLKKVTITSAQSNLKVLTYAHNLLQGLIQSQVQTFEHDRHGQLLLSVKPKDQKGTDILLLNHMQYTYDGFGNQVSSALVTDLGTKVTPLSKRVFDAYGNILYEQDARGILENYGTQYTYNGSKSLIMYLSPEDALKGRVYTKKYTYDGLGRALTEENIDGHLIQNTYDNQSNITKKVIKSTGEKALVLFEKEYDGYGRLLSHKDARGKTTQFTYNDLGKIESELVLEDITSPKLFKQYQYDIGGRVKSIVYNTGHSELFMYDDNGWLLETSFVTSDAKTKRQKSYVRDVLGRVLLEKNGEDRIVYTYYDGLGNIVATENRNKDLTGDQTFILKGKIYDANLNVLQEITKTISGTKGNPTAIQVEKIKKFEYDAFDRIMYIKNTDGTMLEKLEYDANGKQIKSTDVNKNEKSFEYNRNNQLIKSIDALKHTKQYEYDASGNTIAEVDENGNRTTYTYDGLGNVTRVVDALGHVTHYVYNGAGDVLSKRDPNGNTAFYEYNSRGNLIARIDAGGVIQSGSALTYNPLRVERYTYDALGNLTTKTDRNGNVFTYTYDGFNRLVKEKTGIDEITRVYDVNDNLIKITNKQGSIVRQYDDLGRVVIKNDNGLGALEFKYELYNNATEGSGTKEVSVDPKGNTTTKVYDVEGKLVAVIDARGKTTKYSYNPNGSQAMVTYPDGTSMSYGYDANNRVDSLLTKDAAKNIINSFGYVYDKAGNMLSESDSLGRVKRFEYDALNRLISETGLDKVKRNYVYDGAGNRTLVIARKGNEQQQTKYVYNEQNRLMRTEVRGGIGNGKSFDTVENTYYSYDANGNMLYANKEALTPIQSKPDTLDLPTFSMFVVGETKPSENPMVSWSQSYSYNVWNQMTGTKANGTTAQYEYNAEGLRTQIIQNGTTRNMLYVYDDVVLEYDENGNTLAVNTFGHNLISRTISDKTVNYLYNANGDITGLVGRAESYDYDAFGRALSQGPSDDNPYRYGGYRHDESSGLYYLGSRMYNPELGRFMQEDSYRGNMKDPMSLNLYTYCVNNPLIYVDPDGYAPKAGAVTYSDDGGSSSTKTNNAKVPTNAQKTATQNAKKIIHQVADLIVSAKPIVSKLANAISNIKANAKTTSNTQTSTTNQTNVKTDSLLKADKKLDNVNITLKTVKQGGGHGQSGTTVTTQTSGLAVMNDKYSGQTFTTTRQGVTYTIPVTDSIATSRDIAGATGMVLVSIPLVIELAPVLFEGAKAFVTSLPTQGPVIVNNIVSSPDFTIDCVSTMEDIQNGNYGGAAVNAALTVTPYLNSKIDDAYDALKRVDEGGIKYSPINPGPLKQGVAETFTGASYTQQALKADTVFYRVSTDEAGKVGSYMTRTPQMGGMQSQFDLALNPEWGNTAQVVTKVTVPKGTVIYEGTAAPQVINGGAGMLPGGGNQIYIPEVNPKWFK